MSAIAVYWGFGRSQKPEDACRQLLDRLSAFGRDESAVSAVGETGGIALGRALYKLLPEDDRDRQPLVSDDGRFAMVADIRLDNREELLDRLGRAAPAADEADSTILFSCLRQWGERSLDLILGDYAFAWWDGSSRRLLLVRDPLGQRPLYYHRTSGFLAAASMPQALHALPEIARGADPEWLTEFLGYVPHRGSRSQYESIRRVEAGQVVVAEHGRLAHRRFWNPQPEAIRTGDFGALREALRAELDRAVRVRLRRRAGAVGAHLSGGWDSGAVAATAARQTAAEGTILHAFTSVPRPGAVAAPLRRGFSDEGELAAATASMHSNIVHVLVPGSAGSPISNLDELFELYQRPLATLCNNVWMSRIRAVAQERQLRLLLTGEVGNWTISAAPYTLLGEYLRQGRIREWLQEAVTIAKQGDLRYRGVVASSLAPWLPRRIQELSMALSSGINSAAYHAARPQWGPHIARKRRAIFNAQPKNHFAGLADALQNRDFGDHRKGTLARWGIDERDPTADRRLAEFCLSLPLEMVLKRGERRPLAKAALSDRLPPAVLEQKGKGYQAADWHEGLTANRTAIVDLIEEISADNMAASLIDLDAMRRWVRDWPTSGWSDGRTTARYRNALLVGLSAGHFALRANA
jgi:asparagine synthase (glutamine-hydrolysing)